MADPIVFAPQYAGSFGTGTGADASFRQIASDWHQSTVLWDEPTKSYGSGVPIGTLGWGSGLWGKADWDTIQAMDPSSLTNRLTGTASTINFANDWYNHYIPALPAPQVPASTTWGAAPAVPFFELSAVGTENGDLLVQENWTAHFGGFIRITDPGIYNFSVLNDDGFFFRLIGAGGSELEIGRDFLNPRERKGFGDNLELSTGLYGFELGMWNRLEAGVVDLRWTRPGGDWELVPVEHLLPANAVPLPGTLALFGFGLVGLVWTRRSVGRA